MELPSSADLSELRDQVESLLDVSDEWEDWTWEEIAAALRAICGNPVVVFLSRFCDVVRAGGK